MTEYSTILTDEQKSKVKLVLNNTANLFIEHKFTKNQVALYIVMLLQISKEVDESYKK